MSLIFGLTRELISGTTKSPTQTRYAPFFDGVTQYAIINIPIVPGDVIEFEAKVSSDDVTDYLLCEKTSTSLAFYRNAGFTFGRIGFERPIIDGVDSSIVPTDDAFHNYKLTATVEGNIGFIGCRFSLGRMLSGSIYNLKINGTTWPMSTRNSPVQPSAPAGNDMTIINHTNAMWVEV